MSKMNNYVKMFFRRISKDFKQKQLLPLKLLFFLHSSTILVMYPYLTIHMRELGINVEEAAIMSAVAPAIAILMPPLAGMLADKVGNFRILLASFSGFGGLAALLLLVVPVGRIEITYPENVVFGLSCSSGNPLMLSLSQHHPCEPLERPTNETTLQLESCGFACHAVLPDAQTPSVLSADSYSLQVHDFGTNTTKTYTYTLTDEDIKMGRSEEIAITAFSHRSLKNNERYSSSIRKLSANSYYFPAASLFNFSCDSNSTAPSIGCGITTTQEMLQIFSERLPNRFNGTLQLQKPTQDDILEKWQLYKVTFGKTPRETSCVKNFIKTGQHISISIKIDDNSTNATSTSRHLDLGSCATRCLLTTPRKNVCSNMKTVQELDMTVTFWSYMMVRLFVGIVSATAFSMFEGAVIAILREHKADYGLQRIYATIGGMISSPLSGFLIDYASKGKGYTDYSPIFYLYAGLKVVSAFFMLFMNLEFKKPSNSVVSDVFNVLKNMELIALLIACLTMGSAWGYIESFLFWLLQDLGGTRSLMGFTITVAGLVGMPLLVLSGPIIKRIGHANVICIGFLFYVIRLLGYSLIYHPWLCLIFEAMESVTYGLSFTAAVTYAARLSTATTDTTIQAMLGGLHYGVGKGVGSLIGGYLIKGTNIRVTFQIFAAGTAVIGTVYLIIYHIFLKRRSTFNNDIMKKDVEKPVENGPELDLNAKTNGHIEHPAMYEDALTNPAFEDTELDEPSPNSAKTNHAI